MPTNGKVKTVLIVEDDFGLRLILSEKLKEAGFRVIASDTGLNAIYKVKKEKPDLVLLDIMLPGGTNGFEVLAQIKKNGELKDIPIIVMTNLDSERDTALQNGAVDYIVKTNIALDDVVKKIKSKTH